VQSFEHQAIAAFAVVQPRGDTGDRGRASARAMADLGVVQAGIEQPGDRPAEGEVAKLAEGQEVAEEPLGLGALLEGQNRIASRPRPRVMQPGVAPARVLLC